jgi:hypothetical protein
MYGSYESSQAQAASANYQAQVARNNQIIAQQNAVVAKQQGAVSEEAQREKTAQTIGGIEAQEGASGVNPNTGSFLNVRSSAAETGELNALTIRYNAGMATRNALIQGMNSGAQAGLLEQQAGYDTTAGMIGMESSLLGGASSVSNKWLTYQRLRVPGFGPSSGGNAVTGLAMAQSPLDF